MRWNGGGPLPYVTAVEFAYETLREWIASGRLPPGTRVEPGDVAPRVGLSTTPVRQALKRLEGEGLVVLEPHRGALVRTLSAAEVDEVYALRQRLEGWAVELACERLNDDDRRDLAELVQQLDGADAEAYLGLNRAFHFRIFEAARQGLLHRFLAILWDLSELHRNALLARPEAVEQSRHDHRRLWELLQAGRGAEAAALVLEHNERTRAATLA